MPWPKEVLIPLEAVSVVLNLGFTLAIAYEKRIGWLLGFVAAIIGTGLYALSRTWALSALNGYYIVMAAYGWWSWRNAGEDRPVRRAPLRLIAWLLPACAACTALLTWTLSNVLNGTWPQVDAFITVFSFAATWMMARKYIDTWVWFFVADLVAVWLNWRIGYQLYAVQYVVYLVLSVLGFMRWYRTMRPQVPLRKGA
ncbi:MAG TPA: nicotinamide riboside transporter PnuC [Flavobacteriales bacterium]